MRCRVDFKSSAPHIPILNVKNNLMEKENLIEEHKPKSWIQKLKEESWNAELLVTTLSIFCRTQFNGFDQLADEYIY